MPKIYPSLQGIFGFGMPYTLMTRTRLAEDMIFVGAPPSDIYPLLKDTACEHEANWKSALQSMVKVNDDFKVRYNDNVEHAAVDSHLKTCEGRRGEAPLCQGYCLPAHMF